VSLSPFLIPLTNSNQSLAITIAGVQYNLRVIWNNINQAWTLDISDANNNPILQGIPMVTGADLLEQYGYLNFGGMLIAQTDNAPFAVPTFSDLGQTGNLFFVVVD